MSESKPKFPASYVEALAKLMVAHGVTSLEVEGLKLERPLPVKDDQKPQETEWERIQKMPYDAQEAYFRQRFSNGVGG